MNYIKIPQQIIEKRRHEYIEKVQHDLELCEDAKTEKLPAGQLLSNREFIFSLGYIDAQARSTDGVLFDLIVRNRNIEDVQKAAEDVVEIIENQKFTVAEALLFIKHLEGMILASQVKY
jgi:hypothetical protein